MSSCSTTEAAPITSSGDVRAITNTMLTDKGVFVPYDRDRTTVFVGHKVRIYPTCYQEQYLVKACHASRYAFNRGLRIWKETYKSTGKPSYASVRKQFTAEKDVASPWMNEVAACVGKNAIRDLADAFERFFKGQNKYPKYKKRKVTQEQKTHSRKYTAMSFGADNGVGTCSVVDRGNRKRPGLLIVLPRSVDRSRFGSIKMAEPPRWDGLVRRVRISCDAAGRWFASLLLEAPMSYFAPSNDKQVVAGVDVGSRCLIMQSDGTVHANPKPLERHYKKKRRLQRALARQQQGSRGWRDTKDKLTRLECRIADVRGDASHKATRKVIDSCGYLRVESLNVSGMKRNRRVASKVHDANFGELLRQLTYKAGLRRTDLCVADRWFPSSKRCCVSGYVNAGLKAENKWVCPNGECGVTQLRDLCAAINLEQLAVAVLGNPIFNLCRASSARIYAGGDNGSAPEASVDGCNLVSTKPESKDR